MKNPAEELARFQMLRNVALSYTYKCLALWGQ